MTIAIVTRETDRDFQDCIACTRSQTRLPSEVIVVAESVAQEAESRWPYADFILSPANRSAARNIAWKRATSKTICFWEADSTFSDCWVEEVMREFSGGADAVIDRRRCYNPSTYFQRCWDRQFDIRYSDYKPFSAWAFRRIVLERTGGYDEALECAEDSDLGSRILKQGFRISLARNAVQYHKGEPGSFVDMMKRRFRFGRMKALGYYRKRPDELPSLKLLASFLVPACLVLLATVGFPLLAVAIVLIAICLASAWTYASNRALLDPRFAPGIALARILGGMSYHWGVLVGLMFRRSRQRSAAED